MKEVLMTSEQVRVEIDMENQRGVIDLLQNLLICPDVNVYYQINEKGEYVGWVMRDKDTGEDVHA